MWLLWGGGGLDMHKEFWWTKFFKNVHFEYQEAADFQYSIRIW